MWPTNYTFTFPSGNYSVMSPSGYKNMLNSPPKLGGLGFLGLSDTSTAFLVIAAGAAYLIWKMR